MKFYGIKLTLRDIKRDLMINMITNVVIKDEIYDIFMGMYNKML